MKEDLHRAPYSPPPTRWLLEGWSRRARNWASVEVLQPLVEPVLHPSRWRIRAIGASTMLGHPLFFLAWTLWLPQPYEDLALPRALAKEQSLRRPFADSIDEGMVSQQTGDRRVAARGGEPHQPSETRVISKTRIVFCGTLLPGRMAAGP